MVAVAEDRLAERAREVVPEGGLDVHGLPDHALRDELTERHHRRVEVVAVADGQLLPGAADVVEEALRVGVGRRERLLDVDVGAGVERLDGEGEVRLRGRRDVDDVGPLLLEEAVEVVVEGRDAVARGDLLGHEELQVGDRDDARGGRHLLDLLDVAVGDLAAAHDGNLERHVGLNPSELEQSLPVASSGTKSPEARRADRSVPREHVAVDGAGWCTLTGEKHPDPVHARRSP